ncbi:MAG: hypothetical protein ACE5I2_13630 [Anaerolineae bacterium]
MAVREITLALPEELYRDARKAGILSSEYIESLLRDALRSVTWEDRIEEIQREIQKAGRVDKTKEEIIAELRSTRKRLWEAEYSRRLRRRRTFLLSVLLMLGGFMLGGFVTSLMMRNLVLTMMDQYQTQTQVIAVYNLLDYLIPYHVFFGGALLAFMFLTACVWFITKLPRKVYPANLAPGLMKVGGRR